MITKSLPKPTAIEAIESLEEVMTFFHPSDAEQLGLFDVDMVLSQPADPACQLSNIIRHHNVWRALTDPLFPRERETFMSLMLTSSTATLVEEEAPIIVSQLQQQGIPLIALTASQTGKLDEIESLERWRSESLRRLGIDFSLSSPTRDRIAFGEFAAAPSDCPLYSRGILFTNGISNSWNKGDVLLAYLEQADWIPRRVVLVDDRIDNLERVGTSLAHHYPHVEFVGLHYLGSARRTTKELTSDECESRWRQLLARARRICATTPQIYTAIAS